MYLFGLMSLSGGWLSFQEHVAQIKAVLCSHQPPACADLSSSGGSQGKALCRDSVPLVF